MSISQLPGTDQDCDVMKSDNKKLLQIQEKSSSTSGE